MVKPVLTGASLLPANTLLGRTARPASEFPGAQTVPLDYPGRRPESSYIYYDGAVSPLAELGCSELTPSQLRLLDQALKDHGLTPCRERVAVLAVGSNACPGRLEEKFQGKDADAIIVLKGWISDVDSIYCAALANYGALPATIALSPGTEVELWATLLTDAQARIMNRSEQLGEDYVLVSVNSAFRCGNGVIDSIYAYFDRRALSLEGRPVRVAAFDAHRPRHTALTQREVLACVLDRLQFKVGEPIEERHRALVAARGKIAELNAVLASSLASSNYLGDVMVPADASKMQWVRWSSR